MPTLARPPLHLKPNAAVAERVLLPGDPGARCASPSTCWRADAGLNTNRGLWGYTARPPTARR